MPFKAIFTAIAAEDPHINVAADKMKENFISNLKYYYPIYEKIMNNKGVSIHETNMYSEM